MVRVLLAVLVLDAVIAAASDPLDAGLLLHWSLDDAIGSTTASEPYSGFAGALSPSVAMMDAGI